MPNSAQDLLEGLPCEAISFFVFFSRFEYSLKRGHHLKSTAPGARAEPDWVGFAKSLGTAFLDEVRKSGKACALLRDPPEKQIVGKNCDLDWKKSKPIKNVIELFEAVCLVRNNLFHGGKFPEKDVPEVSRDRDLLLQTRWILELALEKRPSLKDIFCKDYLADSGIAGRNSHATT